MTRDEFHRRIMELATEAEHHRPERDDTDDGVTDALAWLAAIGRLVDAADAVKPRPPVERRVVYRVA